MKGDFTRVTFDFGKHYSRVLQQQGRVQLDADQNEASDIQLHFLRGLAADLIGPHGGPGNSFKISVEVVSGNPVSLDFRILPGDYYVDGILCENEGAGRLYTEQPDFPLPADSVLKGENTYLAYLDVWERHITEIEDEDENRIGIREVALRGPDTATRSKITWQVKTQSINAAQENQLKNTDAQAAYDAFRSILGKSPLGTIMLRARAIKPAKGDEPCLVSPQAQYRGAENQLYRVEIHRGGAAWNGELDKNKPSGNNRQAATFKWSRENGSVIFRIRKLSGTTVTLENLGHDTRFGLRPDDWVEIVDDDYVLQNREEPLLQISSIDRDNVTITLKFGPSSKVGTVAAKHPLLRRWDARSGWMDEGAVLVQEGSGNDDSDWIELEDAVQIQFPLSGGKSYNVGDYWLIPARVATGDVEWHGPTGDPTPQKPNGVEHHYAPLGIVQVSAGGQIGALPTDLRRVVKQLWA